MPQRANVHRGTPASQPRSDDSRPSAAKRGYGRRWQAVRLTFLSASPLCHHCAEIGIVTEATELDHIEPHRGDPERFWKTSNLQSLCKPCHSRKTAKGL